MIKQMIASLVNKALTAPYKTLEDIKAIERILAEIASQLKALSTPCLGDINEALSPIPTATGIPLDPDGAIRCFVSYRTVVFWKGILAAVKQQRETCRDEPVHIVDLGSGPYAGLVLPLCTLFEPGAVKITVVDIHAASIQSVQTLVAALELDGFFERFTEQDATHYRHPKETQLHIAVSETMYQALEKEGQVAIFHNIEDQLSEGGVLVPEEIIVKAEWIDPQWEFGEIQPMERSVSLAEIRERRHVIGEVFTLSKSAIPSQRKALAASGTAQTIPGNALVFSSELPPGGGAFLTTIICVFGEHMIDEYDDGLTVPRAMLHEVLMQPGSNVKCNFVIDASPHFQVERVEG
ncbi:hypothetical protein ACFL2V_07450 [Pseudomonadota bacterium]